MPDRLAPGGIVSDENERGSLGLMPSGGEPDDPGAQDVNATEARPAEAGHAIRLPLAKPVVTNVLLGALVVVFVAETVLSRSLNTTSPALVTLGAQVNALVASGAVWRLLAAMFLHIGIMHLAFNGWALFSLGREIEMFYGPASFTAIYFLSGLAGNVAYYLFGTNTVSAGASGAVFGLVGAEVAFFLRNRVLFGKLGRQRLGNLVGLIAINLLIGFTVPGINNLAHLGGLVSGLLLGLGMTPRYEPEWTWVGSAPTPHLADRTPTWRRLAVVAAALVLLVGGLLLGNRHWAGSTAVLRQQAEAASTAGDWTQAQTLLERAVAIDQTDPESHFNLGVVYIRQNKFSAAAASFETVLQLVPDSPDAHFALGLVYAQLGRAAEARALLERFIAQDPTGDRSDTARQVLQQLP